MNYIANNVVYDNPHHAHLLKGVAPQMDDHLRTGVTPANGSSVPVNQEPVPVSFQDPQRALYKPNHVAGDPVVKPEPVHMDQGASLAKQHVRAHSIGPTDVSQEHGATVNAHTGNAAVNPNSTVFTGLPHHLSFDFNLYPITNPPIFDSTFMLPYNGTDGVPRRRRISISNGQIGQIINHEAIFASDDTDQESVPPSTGYDALINNFAQHPHAGQQSGVVVNSFQGQLGPVVAHNVSHVGDTSQDEVNPMTSAAGVPPPNHQLIYNNEVIYNPNNGPIPGTAAWKKERLLERNRIAASKCRQRKKQAQMQLQSNITKYEEEMNLQKSRLSKYEQEIALQKRKLDKYERVFKNYSTLLGNHLAVCDSSNDLNAYKLKVLLKYANIEDITDTDLHNLNI